VKQEESREMKEFRTLLAAIRVESVLLKKQFLTAHEQEEKNRIINDLDATIQVQAFSTVND
jgi:hypothetical protein